MPEEEARSPSAPRATPASCPALWGSPFPWKRWLPGLNHPPILPASLPAGAIPAQFLLLPLPKRSGTSTALPSRLCHRAFRFLPSRMPRSFSCSTLWRNHPPAALCWASCDMTVSARTAWISERFPEQHGERGRAGWDPGEFSGCESPLCPCYFITT